ncbi:UPF0001 protein YggS, partial [Pseudomonas sp. FEN]
DHDSRQHHRRCSPHCVRRPGRRPRQRRHRLARREQDQARRRRARSPCRGPAGLRRKLSAGSPGQTGGTDRPALVLALHRPHSIEQDSRHRRALRLGTLRGSPENRPTPVRATPGQPAAAEHLHPGQCQWRGQQVRLRPRRPARPGHRHRRPAEPKIARIDGHSRADGRSCRPGRGLCRRPYLARQPQSAARYFVHGHEPRPGIGHCPGRHLGADRYRAVWRPRLRPGL